MKRIKQTPQELFLFDFIKDFLDDHHGDISRLINQDLLEYIQSWLEDNLEEKQLDEDWNPYHVP
jgi:hypothetical protein